MRNLTGFFNGKSETEGNFLKLIKWHFLKDRGAQTLNSKSNVAQYHHCIQQI